MAHTLITTQESLLSFFDGEMPAPPPPPILGETFEKRADGERLGSQQRRVEELMQDGEWRSLNEIAVALRKLYRTHFPEASISARLRDMRRAGYVIERKRKQPTGGLWVYRALKLEVIS
jgi:hypothetical protein